MSSALKPRLLFLYRGIAEEGFGHIRAPGLLTLLSNDFSIDQRFGIVPDDWHSASPSESFRSQCIPEGAFLSAGYAAVFIEGPLHVESAESSAKGRSDVFRRYLNDGGIVVLNLVGEDLWNRNAPRSVGVCNAFLIAAGFPHLYQPRPYERMGAWFDGDRDVFLQGVDTEHAIKGEKYYEIVFDDRYLSHIGARWHRVFEGIDRIAVAVSIQLDGTVGEPLLVGNSTTRLLSSRDTIPADREGHQFGTVNSYGAGCAVTIAAGLWSDGALAHAVDADLWGRNLFKRIWELQAPRRRRMGLSELVRQIQQQAQSRLSADPDNDDEVFARAAEDIHTALSEAPSILSSMQIAEATMRNITGECWEFLDPVSRQFLATGEAIFTAFRGVPDFDFAPVAVEWTKALELEVGCEVVRPAAGISESYRSHR